MGWFKKEAKAFGREFARQGSILLFGKAPKPRRRHHRYKTYGSQKQYRMAQRWAKQNGFK